MMANFERKIGSNNPADTSWILMWILVKSSDFVQIISLAFWVWIKYEDGKIFRKKNPEDEKYFCIEKLTRTKKKKKKLYTSRLCFLEEDEKNKKNGTPLITSSPTTATTTVIIFIIIQHSCVHFFFFWFVEDYTRARREK